MVSLAKEAEISSDNYKYCPKDPLVFLDEPTYTECSENWATSVISNGQYQCLAIWFNICARIFLQFFMQNLLITDKVDLKRQVVWFEAHTSNYL